MSGSLNPPVFLRGALVQYQLEYQQREPSIWSSSAVISSFLAVVHRCIAFGAVCSPATGCRLLNEYETMLHLTALMITVHCLKVLKATEPGFTKYNYCINEWASIYHRNENLYVITSYIGDFEKLYILIWGRERA